MKILENCGEFFAERDLADLMAAAGRVEAAMGLAGLETAKGKLKITLAVDGEEPVTLISLALAGGEGGNCADEKTKALIDNPDADFTTECEFLVGERLVSWQGGLRAKFDGGGGGGGGGGGCLIIAFSGLAGWQDLFFAYAAAIALARTGGFGDGRVLTIEGIEAPLAKNWENYIIYRLVGELLA